MDKENEEFYKLVEDAAKKEWLEYKDKYRSNVSFDSFFNIFIRGIRYSLKQLSDYNG